MNLPSLISAAPLSILASHAGPALQALAGAAASRPDRKPVYKVAADGCYDLEEDWSLAAQHNTVRLLLQRVGNGTALLSIKGLIMKNAPEWACLYGYCTSLTLLDLALDMVAQGGFSALILNIDSGGGQTIGLVETAARLRALSQRGIRTTAYTGEVCASAAYFLAAACDDIFAAPTAIVGSIGTYCVITDFSKLYEANGIEVIPIVARACALKISGIPGTTYTDEQKAEIQRHVDEADTAFLSHLAARRPSLNLDQAATGAWWTAASPATPRGLVDDANLFHSLNDLLAIAAA